ncbi:MAG TPA: AmmeMemoRadiSam system protein B [Anaerolineales bacterium]|nr:AmmeMemoRadiSam system protein B [Anaerolineales bacterium]
MATIAPVRPSPLAGTWYEGNPVALSRAVDQYLDRAELPELPGEVVAVIAPHAGHIYSGPVAGYAFAAVRGKSPDLVAVLSPMHQPFYEPLLTTAHSAYSTPLGKIPVDDGAVADLDGRLMASLGYGLARVAYDQEHSLEIELPFLQRALAGDFKLLPVMVRAQSSKVSQQLGMALADTVRGKNALLVASTDLSHFYTQKQALAFDTEMLRRIEAFSPEDVFCAEEQRQGFACGLGALTAVLWAARELGGDTVKVLHHATSGDVTGDYSSVVGYGAAAVLRTKIS